MTNEQVGAMAELVERALATKTDKKRWLDIAESCSISILQRLVANYETDRDHIADSDLDNEQPISIRFRGTLGDIRNARRALQCFDALRKFADGEKVGER